MKPHIFFRRVHYWASLPIALPILVIIATGLVLQLKKSLPWVQPVERRGVAADPALSMPQILGIARAVPGADIATWDDVYRLEIRPGRGLVKVVASNRVEIQIDASTGRVLQVAQRRSDLIESLHDGSWFHPLVKSWVFIPAGLALLGMLVTGVYLFLVPILAKRRRARRSG